MVSLSALESACLIFSLGDILWLGVMQDFFFFDILFSVDLYFLICDRISDRKQFKEEFILVPYLRREVADHGGSTGSRERKPDVNLAFFLFRSGA